MVTSGEIFLGENVQIELPNMTLQPTESRYLLRPDQTITGPMKQPYPNPCMFCLNPSQAPSHWSHLWARARIKTLLARILIPNCLTDKNLIRITPLLSWRTPKASAAMYVAENTGNIFKVNLCGLVMRTSLTQGINNRTLQIHNLIWNRSKWLIEV